MFAKTLILSALFCVAHSAFAANYFVRPVKSPSLNEEQTASINDLLRIAVDKVKGASSIDSESGADAVLEPRVVKLGSAYLLSVKKTRKGQSIFQQEARANSMEDMDTVTMRVVRAVILEKEFQDDTRIGEVTEAQVKQNTRRIETTNQWMFGLGPAWGTNIRTGESGVYWLIGYSWGIDANWALTLGLEGVSIGDSNASFTNFFLGGEYYFTNYNSSPYASFSFGRGTAYADDDNNNFLGLSDDKASGWSGDLGVGMKFFRAHRVNMSVSLKYLYIFDKTSAGNPSATIVYAGLYF